MDSPKIPIERKTLHKDRLSNGTHNYFFEVKEALNGSKYVVVDQYLRGTKEKKAKLILFEDEMPEFRRIFLKLLDVALASKNEPVPPISTPSEQPHVEYDILTPGFFHTLTFTNDWKEFEHLTGHLLRLLGIQTLYSFTNERQAGKADGFFKLRTTAVLYDCTLNRENIEQSKREQIANYCNRLRQGTIQVSDYTVEEVQQYQKQVWIITQGTSRKLQTVNDVNVKEISIEDLIVVYKERLLKRLNNEDLEMRLRNL